jgi:beta-mannosidase
VQVEVEENIKRLRNHPSIAVWNGNNEIYEGWINWGWQTNLNETQKHEVFKWYHDIFNKIIPKTLKSSDPSRPYWSTSPLYGWGHEESLLVGDSHYWGVWAGKEDIEVYNKKFGRFNSEYGMQGMPCMNSVKKFSLPEDWSLDSPVMLMHEKHPT